MSSKVTANNIVGDSFLLNTLHICRPAINPQPAITLLLLLLLKPPSVSSTLYTLEIPALSSRASSYLFGSCRGQPINFKSDFHGFTHSPTAPASLSSSLLGHKTITSRVAFFPRVKGAWGWWLPIVSSCCCRNRLRGLGIIIRTGWMWERREEQEYVSPS